MVMLILMIVLKGNRYKQYTKSFAPRCVFVKCGHLTKCGSKMWWLPHLAKCGPPSSGSPCKSKFLCCLPFWRAVESWLCAAATEYQIGQNVQFFHNSFDLFPALVLCSLEAALSSKWIPVTAIQELEKITLEKILAIPIPQAQPLESSVISQSLFISVGDGSLFHKRETLNGFKGSPRKCNRSTRIFKSLCWN